VILHDTISSAGNPRVREAARLRDADARRETGLTLVDGRRELARAARGCVPIEQVFVDADATSLLEEGRGREDPDSPDLAALAGRGCRITVVSRRAFERIAFGGRNEGLVAVARWRAGDLKDSRLAPDRPVLVLEAVEKPGNLGAILRTADAAGLAGVVVCDGRTDPANPAVIRASLGTVFTVPLATATAAEAIAWCQATGRRVFAAMPAGSTLWHAARLAGPTAILLGSEARGISNAWHEAAAAGRIAVDSIRLPMAGAADSLNVAATAAVLAYEAVRQRNAVASCDRPSN
jgi:TrmH family RNA methyltransferase